MNQEKPTTLRGQIFDAARVLLFFVALTGAVYPLAVYAGARALAPGPAGGSLILMDGKVAGSSLIGQDFQSPHYFWGRPSATGGRPYNGLASGGSNYGPAHPALAEAVAARIRALQEADPGNDAPVPIDLVTASGSGLDPHISPAAAFYQAARVARARGLAETQVRDLIAGQIENRRAGFWGEDRVQVLALNLALDRLAPPNQPSAPAHAR